MYTNFERFGGIFYHVVMALQSEHFWSFNILTKNIFARPILYVYYAQKYLNCQSIFGCTLEPSGLEQYFFFKLVWPSLITSQHYTHFDLNGPSARPHHTLFLDCPTLPNVYGSPFMDSLDKCSAFSNRVCTIYF